MRLCNAAGLKPLFAKNINLLSLGVGDILMLTGTDVVNAIVLLSGIIMLPTNVHILCSIANGRRIE